MLTSRSRACVWPTLLLVGAGFALANGMGYACGNLRQYLLHGLHGADPTYLANDWFTTQTLPHHAAFNAGLTLAARTARLDVLFAAANALSAFVIFLCVWRLAQSSSREPLVVAALVVFIMTMRPGNDLGWTYILSSYFQPSTLGAVGLLAGLTLLATGRYAIAGLPLFVGALFHINYFVWTVAIVGPVLVLHSSPWRKGTGFEQRVAGVAENGVPRGACPLLARADRRRIGPRAALFIAASLVVALLYHLPFFLAARTPEQLACAPRAAAILHDIYMPCHSRPLTWGWEPFARFACVLAAGAVAAYWAPPRRRTSPVTRTILAILAAYLLLGIVFTTVLPVDAVALVLPYRLAPLLTLAAEIAVAGAIASTALRPAGRLRWTLLLWSVLAALLYGGGVTAYGLLCLGVFATAMLGRRLAKTPGLSVGATSALLGGLIACLFVAGAGKTSLLLAFVFAGMAVCWKLLHQRGKPRRNWTSYLLLAHAAVPLAVGALLVRAGVARKDFLGPPPAPEEQQLYDWCRGRTASGSVFVIEPFLGGFRLGAERAVVIDWKCMPILPRDTIEWYERLREECGGDFCSVEEVQEAYARMDAARAAELPQLMGGGYRGRRNSWHTGDLSALTRLYRNALYSVFDLRSLTPSACGRATTAPRES